MIGVLGPMQELPDGLLSGVQWHRVERKEERGNPEGPGSR